MLNDNAPYVSTSERLVVEELGPGLYTVTVRSGFKRGSTFPEAPSTQTHPRLDLEPMRTTYFVARATVVDGRAACLPGNATYMAG